MFDSAEPMSPLTPLSQLSTLTTPQTTCISTLSSPPPTPTPLIVDTASTVTLAIGFDPAHPSNRRFDAPRDRGENCRWTEAQRYLASNALHPSSLQALEHEVWLRTVP